MPATVQAVFGKQVSAELLIPRSSWEFSSKDTLESTHGIHTYVAAMNPHLAREILKRLAPANVLDPFVGGGAVLVEALLNGIPGEGLDVNPLAVLIAKVKTTHIPMKTLLTEYARILGEFDNMEVEPPRFPSRARIEYWFKPYMLRPLAKLAKLVSQIADEDVRDVFRVVLSGTVRDVSLTYRGEVRLRKLQGRDYDKFKPDVLRKFQERAELTIQRVSSLPLNRTVEVSKGNAMKMEYQDGQFSGIVCSPPYGDDRNGVGYFQFSKNMLYWLGFTEREIDADKRMFLGQVKNDKKPPRSETLKQALETIKTSPIPSNPNAVEEAVAFYHDYQVALNEMSRVCSGKIAIVIGDRRLSQTFIDNAQVTTELIANAGYALKEHYHRKIDKKRIAVMQPGGGQRDRSGGGLINEEHTLIFVQK